MKRAFTRRAFAAAAASVALAGCSDMSSFQKGVFESGSPTTPTPEGPTDGERAPSLRRLATTVAGAEFTGLFLTDDGHLFFNVQHPYESNSPPFDVGAVGVVSGYDMRILPFDFESVPVPKKPEVVETAVGEYTVLANGGDAIGDVSALGATYSLDGEPLTAPTWPDFNGFVRADDATGYLFTNWETQPGMVSRLRLEDRSEQGDWVVTDGMNLDFRSVEGTWHNCFGTVSPWGTPLSSEELYFDETAAWNDPQNIGAGDGVTRLSEYLGYYPNPYRYGYIVEIREPQSVSPSPVKQFTMGRFSHENALVMPDERTVYLTDDGTATAFFKFVADEAADLSAGTLFAATVTQDDGTDVATTGFDIEWRELAHASTDEIASWIREYDSITQDEFTAGESSYITESEIRAWARGDAADDRVAFLESRRAAGAIGATAEFTKMEGINARSGVEPGEYLYVAVSDITETMTDGHGDVTLDENRYGAVYRMRLDSDYDIGRMEPAIVGGPTATVCDSCPPGGGDSPVDPKRTLANPDNLVVMQDGRVIVGEDADERTPSMLWVFDPGSE